MEMLDFAEPDGSVAFKQFVNQFMGLPPDHVVIVMALRSVEQFLDMADPLLRHKDYMARNHSPSSGTVIFP